MLNANLYDQHVAARLLDFFGARTPWQRTLWTPSTVLILKEVLEASEAIQAGVLKDASLRNLSSSVLSLTGPDPGVGGEERRRTLHNALRSELRFNGAEFHVVKTLLAGIEEQYLHLLAQAVGQNPRVGPERVARYVAAHMLDSGFSASYLHRWWTFRVTHQNGTRSLSDLLEDANQLVAAAPKRFRVLVAFEAAAEGKSGMPAGWLTAREISSWLKTNGFDVANLRQNGGMWFQTQARDPWSAVENVVEIVDRLSSRIGLGTTGHLTPIRTAWVEGEREHYAFRIRRRRVEVHALHREDKLYALGQGSIVDAAIELLGPLDSGSPGPAITGAWAAIEALLIGPSDDDVIAADRLASLVACSFARAELTALSYCLETRGREIARRLSECPTNRDRAATVADAIVSEELAAFEQQSNQAAVERMRALLADPNSVLRDLEAHVTAVFRRLYRTRNLIVHWGKTDCVGLGSTLRTAAPLVGAGMDRIAHGWFVEHIGPIELSARARIGIDLVGTFGNRGPVDLLE